MTDYGPKTVEDYIDRANFHMPYDSTELNLSSVGEVLLNLIKAVEILNEGKK